MKIVDHGSSGVLKKFVSSRKAAKLAQKFIRYCDENNLLGDDQVITSQSAYNFIPFIELLCNKTKQVGKAIGEPVIPTYTYARVYKKGSVLAPHTDRDACEISITLNLKKDVDWPIFINNNTTTSKIELNPGDGLLYEGCAQEHWREEYSGEEYVQVFLHYVRAKGKRSWAYFDKYKTKQQLLEASFPSVTKPESSLQTTSVFSITGTKGDKKVSDYIHIIEDVFNEEECRFILDEYTKKENEHEWHAARVGTTDDGMGMLDKKARNVDEISLSSMETKGLNPDIRTRIDELIYTKVNHLIYMYKEKFPLIDISQDTGYMLLRYHKDQHYVQHVDDFKEAPRVITCSIQLNDEFEGGQFAFFDRDITINQRKGTAILFPSNFMYPHEVIPVTKGTRYAIVTWLR